jgi:transposase
MGRVLADYNADRKGLFAAGAWDKAVAAAAPGDADRAVLEGLRGLWLRADEEAAGVGRRLKEFAASAPLREAEARAKLATIPGVGPVTVDAVLGELRDVSRFKSAKAVCSYAGPVPAVRQSGGRRPKEMAITKAGPSLLRWALVEAVWRVVRQSAAWRRIDERIKGRAGGKKAIGAVARRLLTVMAAMLRDGTNYSPLRPGEAT